MIASSSRQETPEGAETLDDDSSVKFGKTTWFTSKTYSVDGTKASCSPGTRWVAR